MQAFCLFSESECLTQTNQSAGNRDESLRLIRACVRALQNIRHQPKLSQGMVLNIITDTIGEIARTDGWPREANNTE